MISIAEISQSSLDASVTYKNPRSQCLEPKVVKRYCVLYLLGAKPYSFALRLEEYRSNGRLSFVTLNSADGRKTDRFAIANNKENIAPLAGLRYRAPRLDLL